jgi:hypothetical protein
LLAHRDRPSAMQHFTLQLVPAFTRLSISGHSA